jgi:UDP-N-acetylglucosamine--N-acetylmuramyl-(pentapeptide) pyrophosphoryl-undecaprenol N-acetylglucosamine transferase
MQVLWMAGQHGIARAREAAPEAPVPCTAFAFIDDMVAACVAADLIVSRAGASSTAEIAMLGKPSILVPFPFATDNHQEQNARAFEERGAAEVLLDSECTGEKLRERIQDILFNRQRLDAMGAAAAELARPGAAERIVEEMLTLVFGSAAASGEPSAG